MNEPVASMLIRGNKEDLLARLAELDVDCCPGGVLFISDEIGSDPIELDAETVEFWQVLAEYMSQPIITAEQPVRYVT